MSATLASEPQAPAPATSAPAAAEQWVIGGAATELATRLRASSGFIRLLIFFAVFIQPTAVLALYAATTLLLPHNGRRLPGWSNLVGMVRLGSVFAVSLLASIIGDQDVFSQGPAVWVPVGGVILVATVALLTSQRPQPGSSERGDRRFVLSALLVLGLAGGVALIADLAPAIRSERLLALGLVAIGCAVAVLGRRVDLAGVGVPAALLTYILILLTVSGAQLQGGIGDTYAAPTASSRLRPVYHRAIGNLTLDLTRLPGSNARLQRIAASVGIGELQIVLPYNASATIRVAIGSGNLNYGPFRGGFALRRTVHVRPQLQQYAHPKRVVPLRLAITARVGEGCVIISDPGEQSSC
jgi:hypothetical protein